MINRNKHNPTIFALELSTWKELRKMVTPHTDQYTKRFSCINLHDHTHQAKANHLGVGVINIERDTQVGYITHRSIHEKIIKHQPSWSIATSITQPSWLRSYEQWKKLHKMVTSHTDQNTKRLSCINIHDYTHQAKPNHLGVGYINMERAMQDGYITHGSIHEKIIIYQPSWSYASSKTQPSWRWSYKHGKSYTSWLHHTRINTRKDYHASTSWSYTSSITQPSWRWSYQHGKSYTRWLHHTRINTRKAYHVSTFMIICIKQNPTILGLEL